MESLYVNDKEWLYKTPYPTFWRALTDNDRGSKFHLNSGYWLSADMFIGVKDFFIEIDGKKYLNLLLLKTINIVKEKLPRV